MINLARRPQQHVLSPASRSTDGFRPLHAKADCQTAWRKTSTQVIIRLFGAKQSPSRFGRGSMNKTNPDSGRFEQSFMFHMIRDFFLLLLLVAAAEMAIRYATLRWDFSRQEPARVDRAAQLLANDVKSIMLNSGGPTAAQTVYPILNRNYDELGLSIAVLPAAVTVASMKETRGMDVEGLQPAWVDGEHLAATVALHAEQFCLGCHVKATVGDVLGTVYVRSYLARKETAWWQEVRLTAAALSLKILVHTVALLLLLKVRMEPLLALRSTVTNLAKGVMNLAPRAEVNSADEFGELAQDLNHFLDRITQIVRDMDKILGEVVTVGARLGTLNKHLERQLDGLRDSSLRNLAVGAQRSQDFQLLAAREFSALVARKQALVGTLDALLATGRLPTEADAVLRGQLAHLQSGFEASSAAIPNSAAPLAVAESQSAEYQDFAKSLREMALLEANMQKVAESGKQVLQRLTQGNTKLVEAAALTAPQTL
jgi:methyl-accepting chemotaxis protein